MIVNFETIGEEEEVKTTHHLTTSEYKEFLTKTAKFLKKIISSIERNGSCFLGLSAGGTHFIDIYRKLSRMEDIDWMKVYLFLTNDEYCSELSVHSNQKMLFAVLIRDAKIPKKNLVFPNTNLLPGHCAEEYAQRIEEMGVKPDIVVVGLETDGSMGSLFVPAPSRAFDSDYIALHISQTHESRVLSEHIAVTPAFLKKAETVVLTLSDRFKMKAWQRALNCKDNRLHSLKKHPVLSYLDSNLYVFSCDKVTL